MLLSSPLALPISANFSGKHNISYVQRVVIFNLSVRSILSTG